MHSDSGGIPAVAEARIDSYVCALPGISLAELVEQANFATGDDIYLLNRGRPALRKSARGTARRTNHCSGCSWIVAPLSSMEQRRTMRPFCIHSRRHFRPSGRARRSPGVARVEGLQYWEYDDRAVGRRRKIAGTPQLHRGIIDQRMPHHTVARRSRAQHCQRILDALLYASEEGQRVADHRANVVR
jgi:hypothetical protein